ncbi:uncharacterized protein LOC111111918 isoform X4 [Crassostrea virginica]
MKLPCLLEGRRHKRSTARNRMQKTEHTKDTLLDYAASNNTPRNEDADGAHTKDTLLDYAASDNTPRNEDADGAHTKDPPMDDTSDGDGIPTRIHCWTMQLLTTHQGMRMQMEHTPRIHQWMTLQMGAQHGSTDG